MSKQNVLSFSKAINTDSDLNKRLHESEAALDAWVKIAADAGFDFTAEEFVSVLGETLRRAVTPASAVREFLSTQRLVEVEDLKPSFPEAVVGGAKRYTGTIFS